MGEEWTKNTRQGRVPPWRAHGARVPHCTLRGMCRVVAGGEREPDCGTGARRSRCGATGQRLDPPVSFVSLSARGVGASARARCARRLWRCDERDERPTLGRPARSASERIGSDAGESIQLSYNDNLISAPHTLSVALGLRGSTLSGSPQARLRKGTRGAALGKTRCCNGRGRAGGCRRREVMLVLLLRLLSKRDHVRCCSSGFSARAEQLMQGSELCGLPWPRALLL